MILSPPVGRLSTGNPVRERVYRIRSIRYHAQRNAWYHEALYDLNARYGWLCWYCGDNLALANGVELDHIVPRCQGGQTVMPNLALTCYSCNRAKGKYSLRDHLAWLRRIGVTEFGPYVKEHKL